MRAIFIAVGSEMLELGRVDTNSLYVGQKLMEKGVLMDMKIVIRDDMENLTWLIKHACKRAQLVIITGGLGPTEDDITREATANALKKELEFRPELRDQLESLFKVRGLQMAEINTRQAFIIQGAEVIPNPNGTAPGLYIDDEQYKLVLLPGPPSEMKPMFDRVLEEKIVPLCPFRIYRRCLKFGGVGESKVDSMISDLYSRYKNPQTTILASPGMVEVHLLGRSKKAMDETQALTDEIAESIKGRLSDSLITERDITFAEYIVEELKAHGLTLSVAESCTGGGLGNTITNIPGSSEVFVGGVIAYSNDLKKRLLGVSEETLEQFGAVSKETASEMAKGVRKLTGADMGLAITGIAGPGGGSPQKPVGLVFIHLVGGEEESITHFQVFPGSRDMIKTRTIHLSLNLIREYLKKKAKPLA